MKDIVLGFLVLIVVVLISSNPPTNEKADIIEGRIAFAKGVADCSKKHDPKYLRDDVVLTCYLREVDILAADVKALRK